MSLKEVFVNLHALMLNYRNTTYSSLQDKCFNLSINSTILKSKFQTFFFKRTKQQDIVS